MNMLAAEVAIETDADPKRWATQGAELRRLRKRRGHTTRSLAHAAGVTNGMITQWEQGRHRPQVDKLGQLAEPLGVPLETLLQLYDYIDAAQQWIRPALAALPTDPLLRITQALEGGPWPQNVSAALYALLAAYADNRRDYWERRYAEAMQAMLDEGSFLAVFDLAPGETTPDRDEQARTILGMFRARLFGHSPSTSPDAGADPIA